jgi:hypothetical protein
MGSHGAASLSTTTSLLCMACTAGLAFPWGSPVCPWKCLDQPAWLSPLQAERLPYSVGSIPFHPRPGAGPGSRAGGRGRGWQQHIDPRLAQEAESSAFRIRFQDRLHAVGGDPTRARNTRYLPLCGSGREIRIALCGDARPITFSGAISGETPTKRAGIMAKYLATSLAIEKVVTKPLGSPANR